jgi:tetratricopeptide (TPR) repeat protein
VSDYPFDLGPYGRVVTTSSETAQTWFNRGLNWVFGYNFEEALACFERALEHDPECVMAQWGVAYAIGPNYNKRWDRFQPDEILEALAMARGALTAAQGNNGTAAEHALVNALLQRYQADEPVEDLSEWSDAYADAMREAHAAYPDDREVASLFVEAMMNRTPWQMWDPRTGEPVEEADTLECKEVLERALAEVKAADEPRHPGLLHLYVHLMEMSPNPEEALRYADQLRGLVPDAGHLNHMATHIDVLCGNYQDVVTGNSAGIAADLKYFAYGGAMNVYSLYRVHNYHFKLYGAMFLGQFEPAMDAVNSMVATVPPELVQMETPPMANYLEGYMSMKTHALVRFGKWQELIDDPLPEDQELYAMTTAMNYYGKGVANAALKNHEAAAEARQRFTEVVDAMPEERMIHVITCQQILGVAAEMLAGEIEYHLGNYEEAFAHLREAVALEDALPYDEPWGWMMPSRHALGALLLEQDRVEEAANAYEADLGLNDSVIRSNQHPDNVWALIGLHDCYVRLGRDTDARLIKGRLDVALSRADREIYTSCFCSMQGAAA